MERRQFLAASIAASTLAMAGDTVAQPAASAEREFYQLRRYHMISGPQLKLTEDFIRDALIPAATRMGLGPIGAFKLNFGQETPAYYVLIPGRSAAALTELDLRLAEDKEFLKAAAPFWNATSTAPPFHRVEIELMAAFTNWPKVTPPAAAATRGTRIFQMRTYESPSNGEHVRKVEMFHAGELDVFLRAGFHPVFFGDVLAGPRLPKLTYMMSYKDMAELEAKWKIFTSDPEWIKLKTSKRFGFDQIISNISNLILSPLDCSQI